ncbi:MULTISPECIES: glycosyltransferase 87 family protein [unclassified Nocardioides]|uniref:glycosyltransferase 87 family protein n=1 Tax=unclassified Nocardioides TaxID=2615069 RepID=UPI0007035AD7|nr:MULTISPECIES: glycosyltransferase 87 family protein [unclassified Nocardioides]KRA29474.1 hypothetical protein ASD81_21070 [Nocardioides sp. Root614]
MDSPRTAGRLVAALATCVGLWCALLAWRWEWFIDLRVYELGASALFRGDLYDVRFHVADLPFTYPPFAAVLMLPVSVMPLWFTAGLWSAACVLVLAWVINATLKACGATYPALVVPIVTAVALLSQPVWSTLSYGQVNLFLMAAILADVLRPGRRHWPWPWPPSAWCSLRRSPGTTTGSGSCPSRWRCGSATFRGPAWSRAPWSSSRPHARSGGHRSATASSTTGTSGRGSPATSTC